MNTVPEFNTVDAPEKFAPFLRKIADTFNESANELANAWNDDSAGAIWADFAKILGRAADACDKARAKRGL